LKENAIVLAYCIRKGWQHLSQKKSAQIMQKTQYDTHIRSDKCSLPKYAGGIDRGRLSAAIGRVHLLTVQDQDARCMTAHRPSSRSQ
ncbi:hypothetical protein, partial [Rhodovulum sulfidophilum]|uniref:hypothetical protein n=1 Tax=Rhodovulum sulfidophilum TaxID=35806 RepID=UPI001F42087D